MFFDEFEVSTKDGTEWEVVELLPLRIGVGDNEGEIGGVGFDEDMFEF